MSDTPTFDGGKDKNNAREMLSGVDTTSIQTKVVKTKTAEGFGKEVRMRTRGGDVEFTTIIDNPKQPHKGPVGGFILSPTDGSQDAVSPETEHKWDKAFFKTTDYDPPMVPEKLPLLNLLHKSQKNTRNKVRLHTKRKSKHVTWTGSKVYPNGKKKECIVSWDHGIKARYRLHYDQDCSGRIIKFTEETPEVAQSGKPNVYVNGIEVETKYKPQGADKEVVLNVVGAAVFKKHLIFISHRDLDFPLIEDASTRDEKIAAGQAHSKTVTLFYRASGEWKVLGVHHASSALKAPWCFKPDGSRASSVRETTYTAQWLMHIDISEDESGNLTSSFSESPISDSTPFYLESTLGPATVTSSGDTGWKDPGDWIAEEYGSTAQGLVAGPRSGTDPVGTEDVASELVATGQSLGYDLAFEEYRANSSQANFMAATVDPSVGVFNAYELYMLYSSYGAIRGQVDFRAVRDTREVVEDWHQTDTWQRFARGKRTIAVDYGFEGEQLIVTEELKDTNASFMSEGHSKRYNEHSRPAWGVENIHSILEQRTRFAAAGKVEWVIKINGVQLFAVSGGVDGGGTCESAYTRKQDGTDTSTTDVVTSYSQPSNHLHVERGWLIDLDARSHSAIYEKLTYEFTPTAEVTTPLQDFMTRFPARISTTYTSAATLHLINRSEEVFKETFALTGGSATFRPYALMMQLCPRFHDANERLEEDSLIQYMAWNSGSSTLDAYRFFYAEPNALFDGMPRGGPLGDVEGQLQSRNLDQTIFSTASRTTAQLTSTAVSGTTPSRIHNITYTTRAYIRDEEYPLLSVVEGKLVADNGASDHASPRHSLRLNPVFST